MELVSSHWVLGHYSFPCGYPATPSPPPASVSINFSYSATGTRPVTFELGHKTIDSKGHPVFVGLVADTTAPNGVPEPPPFLDRNSAQRRIKFSNWQISIVRDSKFTVMSFVEITVIPVRPRNTPTFMEAPYSTVAIDVPESGQHTYTVSISGYAVHRHLRRSHHRVCRL